MIRVAFIGDFQISENYPNTKNFISTLQSDERFDVQVNTAAESEQQRYSESGNIFSKMAVLWRMLRRAGRSAREISKLSTKEFDLVHVPYPAVLSVYLLSLRSRRDNAPLLVVDCFISIYDTVVRDRKLLSEANPLAKLIRHLERKAIARADLVLVDTTANARYLIGLYPQEQVDSCKAKIKALNLCINESLFLREKHVSSNEKAENSASEDILNVLFVGSFVPLQGVGLIIEAAALLDSDKGIKITLLGEGQTADSVQQLIDEKSLEIDWQRGWHSIEDIAEAISQADICLGVFGEGAKANRVLPYKVYMAMASGKAVISTHMDIGVSPSPSIPLILLQQNTPQHLADAIRSLQKSRGEREQLGREANDFYRQYLSNEQATDRYIELIRPLMAKNL